MSKVKLTENEKAGMFELRYIPLNKIEQELEENLEICKNNLI